MGHSTYPGTPGGHRGLFFCFGPGILLIFRAPSRAAWVYAGATLLGLAYSLKPLRFKSRGLLGILTYSLACALAYVFLPWAWLGAGWEILPFLAPAVFLDKWVNLHFHQVTDLDADRRGDVVTYAVRTGLTGARRSLQAQAWMATLTFFIALVFAAASEPGRWKAVALASTGALAVLGGLVLGSLFPRLKERSSLARELPAVYLSSAYAVFRFLPLVLMLRLSLETPLLWIVTGTASVLVALESSVFFRLFR